MVLFVFVVICVPLFPLVFSFACVLCLLVFLSRSGCSLFGACFSYLCVNSKKRGTCQGFAFPGRCPACAQRFLLRALAVLVGGGDGFGHVVQCDLVHVAGGVEVVLRVVEGMVGGAFFGVCAVPQFTHVLCVTVNVVQEGFETIQVFGGSGVIFANILVPFVGDEAGAGAAHADGDGHGAVVADIGGEVGPLLVREGVPRVGERGHYREVCGSGGE